MQYGIYQNKNAAKLTKADLSQGISQETAC